MKYPQAANPLILSYNRLMDAFAKSDDERDFYLDRVEGFLLYVDLEKPEEDLFPLFEELEEHKDRYVPIPKMTFYEIKKIMEGFVNEKVYDIDIKEKLIDIIGAKEARENFLEFIYDHLTELEKWQLFYQERSRIYIIEWLRSEEIHFVFEEDLDSIPKQVIEKLKRTLFDKRAPKDVLSARELLEQKAKTYYSNEALNPRPKRGRPPKQSAKVEIEPQLTIDIYTKVPPRARHALYVPDLRGSTVTFSAKFDSEEKLLASLRGSAKFKVNKDLEDLSKRLDDLRLLSNKFSDAEKKLFKQGKKPLPPFLQPKFKKEATLAKPDIQEEKVGSALEEVLPKKKTRMKKEEEGTYMKKSRKKFGIKKVAQIKNKK